MKYCVIDDNSVFADAIVRTLRRKGEQAEACYNCKDALFVVQRCQPDRIILDLKIADDSGLQLIEPIKKTAPAASIVILTGYSSISTAVAAIKLGADQYLCKPAEIDDIVSAFDRTGAEYEAEPTFSPPSLERLEWEHIQKVLLENNENISATARALGMHRRTLQRKLAKRPVKT